VGANEMFLDLRRYVDWAERYARRLFLKFRSGELMGDPTVRPLGTRQRIGGGYGMRRPSMGLPRLRREIPDKSDFVNL
jgi:hypothetical protein